MEEIKVSVILTIYNKADYLRRCLDSILEQTLKEIEIICVNDESTDNSAEILGEYAEKDERVKVLNRKNGGAGAARNTGMLAAKGKYLSFLDADDFFELDKLELEYNTAEKNQSEIVVGRTGGYNSDNDEFIDMSWTLSKEATDKTGNFSYKELDDNLFFAFMGYAEDKLFLRSFIDGNNLVFPEFRSSEDLAFTYSALVLAKKISTVDKVLNYYRLDVSTSVSHSRDTSWWCFYEALMIVKNCMLKTGIYEDLRRQFINYCLKSVLWHYTTLTTETQKKLYEKLTTEWFDTLEMRGKERGFFTNKGEYDRFYRLFEKDINRTLYAPNTVNPRVSVILHPHISFFNLDNTLHRLCNQTLRDIEIIVITEHKEGQYREVLEKYSDSDERVRMVSIDKNSHGYALNRGMHEATGEYLAFVESFDEIPYDLIERLYTYAKRNGVEVLTAGYYAMDFNQRTSDIKLNNIRLSESFGGYDEVVNTNGCSEAFSMNANLGSGLYARAFIESNGLQFNEAKNDYFCKKGFWIKTILNAEKALFIDDPIYIERLSKKVRNAYSHAEKNAAIIEEYKQIREQNNNGTTMKLLDVAEKNDLARVQTSKTSASKTAKASKETSIIRRVKKLIK